VLGGHGYINEHPVEMMYRENRLNPIHEGTTGIQSLDLLARKVPQNNHAGYTACLTAIRATIGEARKCPDLGGYADEMAAALASLERVTEFLLGAMPEQNIDLVLANSVKYLHFFGHVLIAWMWLKQGLVASAALAAGPHESDCDFYQGKLQALRYFFRYELPETEAWAALLVELDDTCYAMQAN